MLYIQRLEIIRLEIRNDAIMIWFIVIYFYAHWYVWIFKIFESMLVDIPMYGNPHEKHEF